MTRTCHTSHQLYDSSLLSSYSLFSVFSLLPSYRSLLLRPLQECNFLIALFLDNTAKPNSSGPSLGELRFTFTRFGCVFIPRRPTATFSPEPLGVCFFVRILFLFYLFLEYFCHLLFDPLRLARLISSRSEMSLLSLH